MYGLDVGVGFCGFLLIWCFILLFGGVVVYVSLFVWVLWFVFDWLV